MRPSSFILSESRTFLRAPRWISTKSGKSCIRPIYSFRTSIAGSMSYLGWGEVEGREEKGGEIEGGERGERERGKERRERGERKK